MSDLVIGEDGLARPTWAASDPLLRDYYDTEWGIPVRDERGVFERLSLEAFQSGLSWATILRKRSAFRAAFANFDPDVVAAFDAADEARLLADAGIVRNRAKVAATIQNAKATVALRPDGGLAPLVWSFQPDATPAPSSCAEIPTQSPESKALSKELKRRGFAFVGPTTMFALMEAIGIRHRRHPPRREPSPRLVESLVAAVERTLTRSVRTTPLSACRVEILTRHARDERGRSARLRGCAA